MTCFLNQPRDKGINVIYDIVYAQELDEVTTQNTNQKFYIFKYDTMNPLSIKYITQLMTIN